LEGHLDVRYPGLEELLSPLAESEPPVEARSLDLRVEKRAGYRALACSLEHRREQRRSHALAAPLPQPRHAPDAPVGQQARRADGLSVLVEGHGVGARLVPRGPFELARYALLIDAHPLSHRPGERQRFLPDHDPDRERRGHERLIILRMQSLWKDDEARQFKGDLGLR